MNHKVLLADDSLTIQKVIKITLANQPYDITDCIDEDELFQKLSSVQPKLVFLDFNLSEKYTGYELTTKIKSLSPATKVLLLLGTFDTVDDAAMEKCGASDKIVKPFDSNKFIAICKQLIETFADDEIPYPETKKNEESILLVESPEDQWTVSHTTEQKFAQEEQPLDNSFPGISNPLIQEMSEWGMSVPGVINSTDYLDSAASLPPVIGDVKPLMASVPKTETPKYETQYPVSDDLDYPSFNMEEEPKTEAKEATKLIPIDSFIDVPLEMDAGYTVDESDVSLIEAQIKDEVEGNLWQADEYEDLKKEVTEKFEEARNSFQPTRNDFDESLFKPLDEKESIDWMESQSLFREEDHSSAIGKPVAAPFDMQEVRSEMEQMVKKYIKEYMDEMFSKNTEKVAWEIIPDLAENLIRQELSKISHKILNEQD